jgi:hypothetical protein
MATRAFVNALATTFASTDVSGGAVRRLGGRLAMTKCLKSLVRTVDVSPLAYDG